MADDVKQVLARIVREYGPSITEDARRCESLLRDLCPGSRREAYILAGAARERVPGELLGSAGNTPYPVIAARLRRRLEDNLSLTTASAAWAVETWAYGLGIVPSSDEPCSASRSGRDGQATVTSRFPTDADSSEPRSSDPITVSQRGRGQYSSIGAALAGATPGATILVGKGLYSEGLTINKPVQIIGNGKLGDTVISSEYGPCLTMCAGHATVRGIAFRKSRPDMTADVPSVDIGAGRLVMEDCNISSASSDCVAIHGADTDPIIRRCKIHDSAKHGVYVYDNGRGTIEQCDIWGNRVTGVRISRRGDPTVTGCSIHDSWSDGVAVCEDGLGTVEHCDIWGNRRSGVRVWNGGNPSVMNCSIRKGAGNGVHVRDNGRGTLVHCDIWGNSLAGIEICEGGNPTIRDCGIHHNAKTTLSATPFIARLLGSIMPDRVADSETGGGVCIRDCRSSGTIEQCDIWGNGCFGIAVSESGSLMVRGCAIHDNQGTGILVYEHGRGTFERCETWANSQYGADIKPGCVPIFRECTHHDSRRS